MNTKIYNSIIQKLAQSKHITISDIESAYDDFQVDEDEEINFEVLLKDVNGYKQTQKEIDPEIIKVKKMEKTFDKLAKEARALNNTEFSRSEDFLIVNRDEKILSNELLDRLDFLMSRAL